MNLFDRVASIDRGVEVISDWLGDGGVTVDKTKAQARANICLKCPQNRSGSKIIACVAEAIKKHVEVKNKLGLRVTGEKSLNECSVCLCCLRLKVWVPIEVIRRHMMDDEEKKFLVANAECWQVNE